MIIRNCIGQLDAVSVNPVVICLILISNKNLQFAPAEITPYCVVVLGGRQPACVLRLVWRDFCSLLG